MRDSAQPGFWQRFVAATEHKSYLSTLSAEHATNLLYVWLHSRALPVGTELAELTVHSSTSINDELQHICDVLNLIRSRNTVKAARIARGVGRELMFKVNGLECVLNPGDFLLREDESIVISRRRTYQRSDRLAVGVASCQPLPRYFWHTVVRLYINLQWGHESKLRWDRLERLSQVFARLDSAGIPYEAKIFIPSEGVHRTDPVVLYFSPSQWRAVANVIATTLQDADLRGADSPSLAMEISDGLSLSLSSPSGGSFGLFIANLARRAILNGSDSVLALRQLLNGEGREDGFEYSPVNHRRNYELDELPAYFRSVRGSFTVDLQQLTRAVARGGPLCGCPPLLSLESMPSSFSSARIAYKSSWDLYSGDAGWFAAGVAIRSLDQTSASEIETLELTTTELMHCAANQIAKLQHIPFSHGYLSGTLGALFAAAVSTKQLGPGESRIVTLQSALRAISRSAFPEVWDMSSGLSGTLLGLSALATVELCVDAREEVGSIIKSMAGYLLENCPADLEDVGLAHGSSGVALALLCSVNAGLLEQDEVTPWLNIWAESVNGRRDINGRWCDGVLSASVVAASAGLMSTLELSSRADRVVESLRICSTPVVDVTLCHGWAGTAVTLSVVDTICQSGDRYSDMVSFLRDHVVLAASSPNFEATILDRVGDSPSAGLFDGPLGCAAVLAEHNSVVLGQILFPGIFE